MQIANGRLKLARGGSDVPIFNVTPAEVVVLNKGHEIAAGGTAVHDLTIIGEDDRSSADELQRLKFKYPNLRMKIGEKDANVVEAQYPGATTLPDTFKAIGLNIAAAPAKPLESYDPVPEEEKKELPPPPVAPKATPKK